MKYFKLVIFSAAFGMMATFVAAQTNNSQSITVVPSPYPDKTIKPAVVITNPQERNSTAVEVHQEAITVTPESKLSIGKASAVPSVERGNQGQPSLEKNKINYIEQKTEKQEEFKSNPSVSPK